MPLRISIELPTLAEGMLIQCCLENFMSSGCVVFLDKCLGVGAGADGNHIVKRLDHALGAPENGPANMLPDGESTHEAGEEADRLIANAPATPGLTNSEGEDNHEEGGEDCQDDSEEDDHDDGELGSGLTVAKIIALGD